MRRTNVGGQDVRGGLHVARGEVLILVRVAKVQTAVIVDNLLGKIILMVHWLTGEREQKDFAENRPIAVLSLHQLQLKVHLSLENL